MDEKKPQQIGELSNGEISTVHCLQTFVSGNTDPNRCLLDHRHVVGTVPDGKGDGFGELADELHHVGLLSRTHSTADHGLAAGAKPYEVHLDLLLQGVDQRLAVNDQGDLVVLTLEPFALKHLQSACDLGDNLVGNIVAEVEKLRTFSVESTGLGDVLSSDLLVASEHPNMDSRLEQLRSFVNGLLPVRQCGGGFPPLLRPVCVLLFAD